jgi:catechol 2,3-dioxygenase-like lactoylglutathione lyase family enzyme
MTDVMSTPALSGIHHLKVHVTDVRRSARWYQRTLGYEPVMEFVEGSRLVGYGMSHPNGGTVLTLRLDPEQAQKTAGWVYFEWGVPDTAALEGLAERLAALGVGHGPVVRTSIRMDTRCASMFLPRRRWWILSTRYASTTLALAAGLSG